MIDREMNEAQALCPQCRNEVNFRKQGRIATCPTCGFHYELGEPPYLGPVPTLDRPESFLFQFLKIMAIALLVLMGVGAVLAGIVFVGCALAFHG